jgi:hypothetical protein
MKLLVHPFLQADALDAFHVSWPGSEGEAIQRVQDLLVFRKLLLEEFGLEFGVVRGLARFRCGNAGTNERYPAKGWGQERTACFH